MQLRTEMPTIVYPPKEVARMLAGISVSQLVAILKAKNYPYTELTPDSKPWGRGRQCWGMTDEQIAILISGQERIHPRANDPEAKPGSTGPKFTVSEYDGKSLIRYPKPRRRRA
jgi:hypothetical protein